MILEPGDVPVCESCAVGVANDDWTHLNAYDEKTANEYHATVMGSMELFGWLSLKGTYENGGYWNCSLCGDVTIGDGVMFHSEKERKRDEMQNE